MNYADLLGDVIRNVRKVGEGPLDGRVIPSLNKNTFLRK